MPPTHLGRWQISQLRVFFFYQICQWKSSERDILLGSWGWTLLDSGHYPTKTDLSPAPDDLLKVIRCNSSADCSSAHCSCQNHGWKCSLACGQCRGTACINASAFVTDDEEPYDEVYQLIEKWCIHCQKISKQNLFVRNAMHEICKDAVIAR